MSKKYLRLFDKQIPYIEKQQYFSTKLDIICNTLRTNDYFAVNLPTDLTESLFRQIVNACIQHHIKELKQTNSLIDNCNIIRNYLKSHYGL